MNRTDKLLTLLTSSADAMLVTHKKNQYYLSGFDFDDGYLFITREKAYLITDWKPSWTAAFCCWTARTRCIPIRQNTSFPLCITPG